MQIDDFKNIVSTFCDPGTEILFEKSRFVISVNGDLIEAGLRTDTGDVYVNEGGGRTPGSIWIVTRLARLPLLASRLSESVPRVQNFVSPTGIVERTLTGDEAETPLPETDALTSILKTIETRSPLETTVLYVTSGAGEGKTSLINEAARVQAKQYIARKTDWLLVPIPLGGRHFLRFDDITIGALQNRYRFPFLYYDSFLALVRMGVLIPAFDGFEEMFVENNSGEALSAMGMLVGALASRGGLLVAARKAYFEFEDLRSQQRLYDSIRTYSVGFGKIDLKRWDRSKFLLYCSRRAIRDADILYRKASDRLTPSHALLTRAVLVKRLVDVAESDPSLDATLQQIDAAGADFFAVFVKGLIEREANEKWIDRSGKEEVGRPLLSVEEHGQLLAQVALAMWESKTDYIKRENLEFVADYFCETAGILSPKAQQVRERLRGHALLVSSPNAAGALEFDHDEFRLFFLGEAIAQQVRSLDERARLEALGILRRGTLPGQAKNSVIRALQRQDSYNHLAVARFISAVSSLDTKASYTHENSSELLLGILDGSDSQGFAVEGVTFGTDSLKDKHIDGVSFQQCVFAATSLRSTALKNCEFVGCMFSKLRDVEDVTATNTVLSACTVESITTGHSREIWNPAQALEELQRQGFAIHDEEDSDNNLLVAPDEDAELRDFLKITRYFMRSTHMSESVIRLKLGGRGTNFIDNILPQLMRAGVVEEIEDRGAGYQRRFRLGVTLQTVNRAVESAQGSFGAFISYFKRAEE